jgi:Asp-tRNA(Asn)/Glu-tRNA(Gln) amidotransferase A subunit family amidase
MARTVADAVAVFNVVAGEDPADTITATSRGHREPDYNVFVKHGALKGARIGVLRQAYLTQTTDSEVVAVFTRALDAMRAQGATIVDSVNIQQAQGARGGGGGRGGSCGSFKYDLEGYFRERGEGAPVKTIDAIVRSRAFHPLAEARLMAAQRDSTPPSAEGCQNFAQNRERFRSAIVMAMDTLKLDALVYPTWSNPPRLIGDLNTPAGDNSQVYSPRSGFPAMTVPMGYTRENALPAGMTFFGRAWSEGELIGLAYDFEQATKHRKAPASAPPLARK